MARKQKEPRFQLVVADWKETDELIKQLQDALAKFGLKLQEWDAGDDNTTLTVARRRLNQKQMAKELSDLYEFDFSNVREIKEDA